MRDWLTRLAASAFVALAAASTAPAAAQSYPAKPIRVVAPFATGGLVDALARQVGEELRASLGQPVIVENKPGAGGNIGADMVARAAPDGYTLLMTTPSIESINEFIYESMPFDPAKAFTPISLIADMPMVIVVHPKTGIKTLKELIDHARANPGKLSFGSAGIGTTGHLAQELLARLGASRVTHVPYKGAAPAVQDLIAGQIDGVIDNPPLLLPHIRAGTVTPLAVLATQRLAVLPDVPTSAESGLPGWLVSSWFGLVAPIGTPPEIVNRLHTEIARAVKQPSVQKLGERGIRMVGGTPEEFGSLIADERRRWGELIKATGIKHEPARAAQRAN